MTSDGRQTVPSAADLPTVLVSLDQWVCWRTQERDGKETKVPINPHTGRFGSATDPESWATFETARRYAVDNPTDGVGFVFTADDPFVGVDLDDCRVPETGTLTDDATEIVETLASYTEVSPSGTGVHVLFEGAIPGDRNRSGDVELYDTARFFTVTGDHVDGTPLTIERQIDWVRTAKAGDDEDGYSEALLGIDEEGWFPLRVRGSPVETAVIDGEEIEME